MTRRAPRISPVTALGIEQPTRHPDGVDHDVWTPGARAHRLIVFDR
jgi:hypothetical protein